MSELVQTRQDALNQEVITATESLDFKEAKPDAPEDVGNDDRASVAASEKSETATADLLSLKSRPSSPSLKNESRHSLGLRISRPFEFSELADYDVITVHGLRDDHKTAWTSVSGQPWLRDRLFSSLSIRQLDYQYENGEDAMVFEPHGIEAEARKLLLMYSENRRKLWDTEANRPIIWVCHDIGGVIVKQVLIQAAQAVLAESYEDEETWEYMKEAHRRIVTLSTMIVFLGCPHKTESIDSLEDEIWNLMNLAGPNVKKGIVRKIHNIASQVDKANARFLESRLFSRLVIINVFHLPWLEVDDDQKPPSGDVIPAVDQAITANVDGTGDNGSADQSQHQKDHAEEQPAGSPSESMPFPDVSATPFSRYTLVLYNTFEVRNRYRQDVIDHTMLVRGDEGVDSDDSWVSYIASRFSQNFYPLKISHDLIRHQSALQLLVPPTRLPMIHVTAGVVKRIPFVDWITNQKEYIAFDSIVGPAILYIPGTTGSSSQSAMISQHLHFFHETIIKDRTDSFSDSVGGSFYFEFDKFDSRYNNIGAMMVAFLNDMSWRIWPKAPATLEWVFDRLDSYHCWSLKMLHRLFSEVRRFASARNYTLILGNFDHCVEEERRWFLESMLKEHSYSDINYRVILITSTLDCSVRDSLSDSQVIYLEGCPEPLVGYAIDNKELDGKGLSQALEDLFQRRPILLDLAGELRDLMDECQSTPHLGYRIIDWLSNFGRGLGVATIAPKVQQLYPVTPENFMRVFYDGLPEERREMALWTYRWVKHALEPLTLEELSHAVAASTTPGNASLLDIDVSLFSSDMESVFSGIIVLNDRYVRFSHASFYDVCLGGWDDCDEAKSTIHGLMAKACIDYLMQRNMHQSYSKLAVQNYGGDMLKSPLALPRDDLLQYAVQHWPGHYHLCQSNRPLEKVLMFLRYSKMRNRYAEARYLLSNPFTRMCRGYVSPLPLMASLGLEDVVSQEIESTKDSKWHQKDAWLAISEAARLGHTEIVRQLLQTVQPDESGLRDAVFWVTSSGSEAIALDLLEKIALLEKFSWPEGILSRATFAGLLPLVSAISDSGIDLNERNHRLEDNAIHTAISWRQTSIFKYLLDRGVDISARERYGRTALLLAIEEGDKGMVQALCDNGASVDDKDDEGTSAVNCAVMEGQHEVLRFLISAGADVTTGEFDPKFHDLRPPITNAADYERMKCFHALLENGADPNTKSKHGSPLYLMCHNSRHIDSCRLLLEKGAEANTTYPDMIMLLSRAVLQDNTELIDVLIKGGADLNATDPYEGTATKTALSAAIPNCSLKTVEYLVEKGAKVNHVPEDSDSPLFATAFRQSDIEKAEFLLSKGAQIGWQRKDGWTPLHAAYDMPKFVSLFLRHNADVNVMSDSGTVLMMAAKWNFLETLQILLAHQPLPELETRFVWEADESDVDYDKTALDMAISRGNHECARLLIEAGAQFPAKPKDFRSIMESAQAETYDETHKLVKEILARGGSAAYVDDSNNTALHGMTSETPVTLLVMMINSGAPTDTLNTDGLTPLAVAVREVNVAAATFLISRGCRTNIYNESIGSLLHLAIQNVDSKPLESIFELVKMLIRNKVRTDAPGPAGQSLLYNAIKATWDHYKRRNLVKYLVEDVKVAVDAQGGPLRYAVFAAANMGDYQLALYLIRRGADPNVVDVEGRQLIHHYLGTNAWNHQTINFLAKAGVDLQAKDKCGRVPLHFAAGRCSHTKLDSLLENLPKPFDINVEDVDGWTPLMWACKTTGANFFVLEELVKTHGADVWHRSKDGEWSALKLANFNDFHQEQRALLEPSELERERVGEDGVMVKEIWDPAFHTVSSPGRDQDYWCDSCLLDITGDRFFCIQCDTSYDLCFKCYPHRKTIHNAEHEFERSATPDNSDGAHSEKSQEGDRSASASASNEDQDGTSGTRPPHSEYVGSESEEDDEYDSEAGEN